MRLTHSALVCATILSTAAPVLAGPVASPLGEGNPLVFETQPPATAALRVAAPPESLLSALLGGADYVQQMQADMTEDNAGNGSGAGESPNDPEDGGWDWVVTTPPAPVFHTTAASPRNIYGTTAMGLYYAYLLTGDAGYFTAMTDAANYAVSGADSANVRSSSALVFLMLYNDLPGVAGTAYKDAAKAKYDGRIAVYGSAGALARYIRDARYGQGYGNGIIAWDVGPFAVCAAMLDERFGGYAADADSIAEVLFQDSWMDNPGYFDVVDDAGFDSTYADHDYWWYNLGITGLIDAFVASGIHTDKLPWLAAQITSSQYGSGAISGSYGANPGDEDWQSTAYSAVSLGAYDAWTHRSALLEMGTYLYATRDVGVPNATGGWRYGSGAHYPQSGGENASGLYFAYLAGDDVAAVPDGDCLSITNTCETVPVVFTRTDATEARGVSVTFTLSGELQLCGTPAASIVQGTWMSGYGNKAYQVLDNGGGSYTVDQALLGEPCGITGGGQLFTVAVEAAGGDGTGTITITNVIVRDCANAPLPGVPGASASITIDTAAPVAVGNLAAVQKKTGNDSDSTTQILLTLTPPVDAATVSVYRKGFGSYPEYDDAGGAVPAIPTSPANAVANGWTLTGVTGSGGSDEPATRDFWYYVAFTADACGNVSGPSNLSAGRLNYHLGDVVPDGTGGNNQVDGLDVSRLGAHYGITLVPSDPYNYLDVGPTTNYSVDARPTTDDKVNFEDLMMFAINHGNVSRIVPSSPSEVVLEDPRLLLAVTSSGDRVFARLSLDDHWRSVQGVHALLAYDAASLEYVGATKGELAGASFFGTIEESGGVSVDVAQLGSGATFQGSGEVAVVEFRRLGGTAVPSLGETALRDSQNRPVTDRAPSPSVNGSEVTASAAAITHVQLVGARPNPFTQSTEITFRIPVPTQVAVRIHDVSGRLVRTLEDGMLAAGEHAARWDGRTNEGLSVGSGVYFYTFRAGNVEETRKILVAR